MMKKTAQTFLLVFSTLLLLVSVTGSAQGQPAQDRRRGHAASFSGVWNAVTGKGKTIVITLRHDRFDSSVVSGSYGPIDGLTGSYKPSDSSINGFVKVSASTAGPVPQNLGSIRGTVTDNVLRFRWVQDNGRGAGRFTFSSDGQSFEGTFSATDNPDDTSGGTLNGTRAPNFAGVWHAKLGKSFMELIFQQTGAQVTGQLKVNSADLGIIREGLADGNTLCFNIVRVNATVLRGEPRSQVLGSGELVMDRGGKSFTGMSSARARAAAPSLDAKT